MTPGCRASSVELTNSTKGKAMEASRTRPFGPARIVALALISLTALGLAYLHFSAGNDSVSVPSGAHAGQLTLHSCHYATEGGSYRADCGTLVVPESRYKAHSRLIALPVTRIRARSAQPGVPIFRLVGGPGLTNMEFSKASRFGDDHDVVLVGYRGVDGSARLDCPEVESALKHSTDFLGEKFFRAYGDAFRSCARRLTDDGIDLARYGLPQQVDDLEAARRALGYKRIDLLSESAGTRTAMIYSWRYPKRIHRSVMIAVNPPGNFLWNAQATDEQIRKYSALCAENDSCRKRSDNLAASIRRADADTAKRYFASGDHRGESILGNPGTRFMWGGGELADAWPANANENEYDRVRTSRVNTLLIGGALDFATPPQVATKELLPYLPNGHQVVLAGLGHTTSFWTEQPRASSHLVNTFFDSGRVDKSLYTPMTVDFTPDVTQTAL